MQAIAMPESNASAMCLVNMQGVTDLPCLALKTGASVLGLLPISRMASAFSTPSKVVFMM